MIINATWSLHGSGGELIAHGVHRFDIGGDSYGGPATPIDPYEPALAVAQSLETALINYLPGGHRILRHDPNEARSIAVTAQ